LEGISKWIEENLKLPVNIEKSQSTKIREVTFLGFQILAGKIRVSTKSRKKFKEKIGEPTHSQKPRAIIKYRH
jgi:hypothetical protein